jgi:ABC-type phosphate transport system permease subunit
MLQLRKFHTYDEWLKDRDPKKRPNHRSNTLYKGFIIIIIIFIIIIIIIIITIIIDSHSKFFENTGFNFLIFILF